MISRTLDARGLALHALERNPSGSPALLFLHGWLDHCHSFDWVGDALPAHFRQLALDFRGHGRSAHVAGGALYGFCDYLADVDAAVRWLSVERVHLVGHSLGGAVALAYAAAAPDRVATLSLIESLGTSGGAAEAAVLRLQRFLAGLDKASLRRTYPSIEAAAARVRENNSSLPEAVALHLTRFGTAPVDGGVAFTFDPAHRRTFGMGFDEQQVVALCAAVRCPVQVIHGTHGFRFDDAQLKVRLTALGDPPLFPLEGGHHVHLERPAEVAAHLQRFVAEKK